MKMLMHKAAPIFQRRLGQVVAGLGMESAAITVQWDSSAAPSDPGLESSYAAKTTGSDTVNALVHYVSATTAQRTMLGFAAGDAIVTFHPTDAALLDGKSGVSFVLPDGKTYVQAQAGGDIQQFWDVLLAGRKMTVTLLLRIRS